MKDLLQELPDVKLTIEEEAALAKRIAAKDENALVKLVMSNIRRAVLYMQKVDGGRINVPNLVSLGYQQLCMAAKRFDPAEGRFFAYAKAGLRGRLMRHWVSKDVVRQQTRQLSLDHMETPNLNDAIAAKGANAIKDSLLGNDDLYVSTREKLTGEIADPRMSEIIARDQYEVIRKRLKDTLSEHLWMILELRWKGRLTFQQIGTLLGVSRARIQRCHSEALKKLHIAIRRDEEIHHL